MRALILIVVSAGTMFAASQQTAPTVDEWEVPFKMDSAGVLYDEFPSTRREATRPRDPYVHPDGRVFFCGQAGNYIASLDPATGEFVRYELPDGTHPHNLIIDEDGIVWYAGNRDSHIGRLDPETGEVTKIAMPDPDVRDPHTLTWDRNGDIWFTAQFSNFVGKLTVATLKVQVIEVPTERARPYGIVMDPSGLRPWIVLFGTNKLATVDPETMELTEFVLPRPETRPRRIAMTTDGHVWYVDFAGGMLGRFDPETEGVREWATPGGPESRPYALMNDDNDRLWFFEGKRGVPVQMVGFDATTQEFLGSTPLESGPGTVRHVYFHAPTNAIYFGADANTVGRATLPPGRVLVP